MSFLGLLGLQRLQSPVGVYFQEYGAKNEDHSKESSATYGMLVNDAREQYRQSCKKEKDMMVRNIKRMNLRRKVKHRW